MAHQGMSKKTLNKTNLEDLGAARLADLLLEVSTGSADIKRRLRLELSHNLGTADLAHEVRKRLVSLRKSSSFVGWRKRKGLIKDLETQSAMILDKIAPEEPTLAFELLWQFIELAPSIFERVDDSKGEVGQVFHAAFEQFETFSAKAVLDPETLAKDVWNALQDNGYGQWDGLITRVAPALGESGLDALHALITAYADAPEEPETEDHEALQFLRQLRGGSDHAAERKARIVQGYLQEIASLQGDTAGYIAQYSEEDIRRADIAAEVATLLLGEGKATEAFDLLQNIDEFTSEAARDAWDIAYIASLLALDQKGAAQEHRWTCFCEALNPDHLRAYLKELPDFEDVEAEDRAKEQALAFVDLPLALQFFLAWPDLLSAAQLIETRTAELDGDRYFQLAPAAEQMRARYPLAATLLWRAMIDFTLEYGRASRYGYALEHLADCAAVDSDITDYKGFASHTEYVHYLQTRHARKTSFWEKLA